MPAKSFTGLQYDCRLTLYPISSVKGLGTLDLLQATICSLVKGHLSYVSCWLICKERKKCVRVLGGGGERESITALITVQFTRIMPISDFYVKNDSN